MDDEDGGDTLGTLNGSTDADASNPALEQRRQRRRAYMGASGRELSDSGRKRLSVQQLGSIRHLQHQFAKHGLASDTAPKIGPSGRPLPLAIPGQNFEHVAELDEDLATTPTPPQALPEYSFESVEMPSIRQRREQVYREIANVCDKWGMIEMSKNLARRQASTMESSDSRLSSDANDLLTSRTPSPLPPDADAEEDNLILTLMQATTQAIRTAQSYFHTLPLDKLPGSTTLSSPARPQINSRQSSLGLVTAARPIPRHTTLTAPTSSSAIPRESSSEASAGPLLRLRKASLNALSALKDMERRYRLTPVERTDIDNSRRSGTDSPGVEASQSYAASIHVEEGSASETSSAVEGTFGHLYRSDVQLNSLRAEAAVIQDWIATVDDLLSQTSKKRVTKANGNPGHSHDDIPRWAQDEPPSDPLERACGCLQAHLPVDRLRQLAVYRTQADRQRFLVSLSDGQLLCLVYNAVLEKSQRPWGFIPVYSIHDFKALSGEREAGIASSRRSSAELLTAGHGLVRTTSTTDLSEEGVPMGTEQRIGMTFRRLENIRVFIAALKLRYLVTPTVVIDPRVIARKEEGWEDLLEQAIELWISAAAKEKRDEEVDSE